MNIFKVLSNQKKNFFLIAKTIRNPKFSIVDVSLLGYFLTYPLALWWLSQFNVCLKYPSTQHIETSFSSWSVSNESREIAWCMYLIPLSLSRYWLNQVRCCCLLHLKIHCKYLSICSPNKQPLQEGNIKSPWAISWFTKTETAKGIHNPVFPKRFQAASSRTNDVYEAFI